MTRIAIVGAGGIARRHVGELLRLRDEATITTVVDLSEDRAGWLIEQTGARFTTDVRSALDHVDAAYVLTPPRARVEVIRTLAGAGKAVFCEKPLAGTVADAREIADIVHGAGIPFMMGFMRRWHPPHTELKKVVDGGSLGRPLQFFRRRLGFLDHSEGNWRITGDQLTGLTVESVSHDLDLLRWLGGDIVAASGEVVESRGDLPGYDDMVVATLRFASGASGLLQVAWSSLVTENQVGVLGTEQAAVLEGPGMWRSERLRIGTRAQPDLEAVAFEDEVADDSGYAGQTRTFLDLLNGEGPEHPGVDDGLATVELSYRILDSSHGR